MSNRYRVDEIAGTEGQVVVTLDVRDEFKEGVFIGKRNEFTTGRHPETGAYLVDNYIGDVVSLGKGVSDVSVGDKVIFTQLSGVRIPGFESDEVIEVVSEKALIMKLEKGKKDFSEGEVLSRGILVKLERETVRKTASGLIIEESVLPEAEHRMTDKGEIVGIGSEVDDKSFIIGEFAHWGIDEGQDLKELDTATHTFRVIDYGSVVFKTKR